LWAGSIFWETAIVTPDEQRDSGKVCANDVFREKAIVTLEADGEISE
jgi:hypothetical protein